MMKSQLILAVAVIGFIASSACSRSSGSNPPPPIEQKPQPTATPIPSSQSELDNDSGKSAQDPKGPQTPSKKRSSQAPIVMDPSANGSTDPTSSQGPEIALLDPTGFTPTQIFERSERQGPALIGIESEVANGQADEPLFFTGGGQDHLRAQLQTWVDTQTRRDRVQRDKSFAKTVTSGRFDFDLRTLQATLDVAISGRVHRFTGVLDKNWELRAGDLRHGDHLSVEAACMDLNIDWRGRCDTVYVKVQDATGGLVRTAHMIIRQTEATLFTKAAGFGLARNVEFDSLLETLVRTDRCAGGLNALNQLTLRTSETVNGSSNFKVEMGIRSAADRQETLNFGGPLVKPADDISLNAEARVLRSTSPAANTVSHVSLINNDGRGTLTLAVTIRAATAGSVEDTMQLTLSRIHKPIRPLHIH